MCWTSLYLQVAAALHQQLEHALKFRDRKDVKQNGDEDSARHATEARTKHESSDGAAPLGVADEQSSLQCRLFHQVTERHLTVNFESEFSQMQQEQLIRAGSEGQALQRSKKGTFDDLTVCFRPEEHSHRGVASPDEVNYSLRRSIW